MVHMTLKTKVSSESLSEIADLRLPSLVRSCFFEESIWFGFSVNLRLIASRDVKIRGNIGTIPLAEAQP